MKAKYAKIIRHGIIRAREDSRMLSYITNSNLPREAVEAGMRVIAGSTPQHPLALRAYIHEVESQYKHVQKRLDDVQRGMVGKKNPFIGSPPAPKPQTKTAPRIAEGFHD
jgi:hypothetical protein